MVTTNINNMKLPDTSGEYDFIIVDAGPAGTVLSSRLSQHSSSPKVLLIYAKPHSRSERNCDTSV
ncbi:hypothetical protein BGZ60DRAFT_411411 [Tricladium varicosporioides]|nr:hypothetical protein BGZ60DRAFT_411411 [Hymenoscyphus varicosporioides]